MTPKTQKTQLEKAPEQKPFLESDYFLGLCEIASCCMTGKEIFIPAKSKGIFNSLFFRRIFAKGETKNGGYIVGDFNTQNKFLYEYDTESGTYTTKKEKNIAVFANNVKALNDGTREFTIFSLVKVADNSKQSLNELLSI